VAADVWKRFQRGERHDSLRDLIPALLRRPRRSSGDGPDGAGDGTPDGAALPGGRDAFWAVQDVSFTVEFGRALGIIGPNGAGKSTMLKLLTGILRPTRGEIRMRGRVASLIEVSAGFHPDLTGRENVYLQGAIMGMTRPELARRLESIVEFSGIAAFIDTPVKRYSSGMNARLGFAIAVHLEPDVLVIDEVLSVGDMAFQAKCVERMKAFKRAGVAIVFVSHNMQAVGELCDEALVIQGAPRFRGAVGEAVGCYLALANGGAQRDVGDGVAARALRLTDAAGRVVDAAAPHTALQLHAELELTRDFPQLTVGLVVRRATDALWVFDSAHTTEELGLGPLKAGQTIRLRFDHVAHLARGQYAYELNVYDPAEARHRLVVLPAAGLRVDEYRSWGGVADLRVSATATASAPPSAAATVSAG
jgi:lipopolysaccharide transport system ATP-binding protein